MRGPLVSVIIPSHNHGEFLASAVWSALAQTYEAIEVIVVDDGSTDQTAEVLARLGDDPRLQVIRHAPRQGVSASRNLGIAAARGEYLMFLDADDTLEPTKVAAQIAAFSPEVGWVLCDVRIEDDVRRVTELASDRYRYRQRELGGWIREQLKPSNFIPVMSPLVRRDVLGDDLRFGQAEPEDWHFWYAVAGRARVRYVPQVLATYRKRRAGRSRLGVPDTPPVDGPIRLNLGCGTPGAPSWHPMPGFVNLDRSMGWCFEDGLPQYADAEVEAITISHSLMYVDERDMPRVFAEFARVLQPGGVIRITEDDTAHPNSRRRGGWRGSEPFVTLTSPERLREWLRAAGLRAVLVEAGESCFRDRSLIQQQHGDPPDVCFVEGIKDGPVLFAPHADDETLFAGFILQAQRPRVVICFPSAGDYGETDQRIAESRAAVALLGAGPVEQWQGGTGRELLERMRAFDRAWRPSRVLAPDLAASHPDHVSVAKAAAAVFAGRLTTYHTYVDGEKVRSNRPVPFEPSMVGRKLEALACYRTQHTHPRAHRFFLEDLREYYGRDDAQ